MQMFQKQYFYYVHLRKFCVVNYSTQSAILTAVIFCGMLFKEKLKLFILEGIEWLLKYCVYFNTADH